MELRNFNKLHEAFSLVQPALQRWLPEGEFAQLSENIGRAHEDATPRVMVYGIYNAGKSTLINALIGEMRAPMSDRPETDRVTEYPWRGYKIIDTPGVDAPEAHQAVTDAELMRCDAVVYVIAGGGASHERKTWDALFDLLQRGRRVMLVINNKAGLDPDGPDYLKLFESVKRQLQDEAEKRNVANVLERVRIRVINAKLALKARIEGKLLLLDRSGFNDVEHDLATFVSECDASTVAKARRQDLLRAIEKAERALQADAGDAKSRALVEMRQDIRRERERLSGALMREVSGALRGIVPPMRRDLLALLEASKQDGCEADLERIQNQAIESVGERLQAPIEREIKASRGRLQEIGETAEFAMQKAEADLHVSRDGNQQASPEMFASAGTIIREKMASLPLDELTKTGTIEVLKLGKEFFPELFKGIGPKTMGKWAANFSKWAGPAAQVCLLVYEVYTAFKGANEEQRAAERRMQTVAQAVDDFVASLREQYAEIIDRGVAGVFEPMDAEITRRLAEAQGTEQASIDDHRAFEAARAELAA